MRTCAHAKLLSPQLNVLIKRSRALCIANRLSSSDGLTQVNYVRARRSRALSILAIIVDESSVPQFFV